MEYSVRGEYLRGDFFVVILDFVHELYTLFCVQILFAFRSFMLFYVQFFCRCNCISGNVHWISSTGNRYYITWYDSFGRILSRGSAIRIIRLNQGGVTILW